MHSSYITYGCSKKNVNLSLIQSCSAGGNSTFFGLVNTFVHIIMYVYYMMAAMGPQYRRFIWWKKYLTNLQMIQFIMIFVHAFQVSVWLYYGIIVLFM